PEHARARRGLSVAHVSVHALEARAALRDAGVRRGRAVAGCGRLRPALPDEDAPPFGIGEDVGGRLPAAEAAHALDPVRAGDDRALALPLADGHEVHGSLETLRVEQPPAVDDRSGRRVALEERRLEVRELAPGRRDDEDVRLRDALGIRRGVAD